MDIPYLISVLERKVIILSNAKSQAFSVGDLEGLNTIEKELLGVQNTMAQLRMITEVSQAAQTANTTPADIVASGIDAVQNQVQGPSASAIVNGYDISAYATDALHEEKIQTIVDAMPTLRVVSDIDNYIQIKAPSSPVTGHMVLASARAFGVNIPLLLAIMQNDSTFGLLGIGARTFNPGNVGNNGVDEMNFGTWEAGVDAVANWLSNHRVASAEDSITVTDDETPVVNSPAPEPTPVVTTPVPEVATTTPEIITPAATTTIPSITTEQGTTTSDIIPEILLDATSTPAALEAFATSTSEEATTTSPN
jgi:hypothetical protein